ncbi:MAG: peptide chain release factor N(5)-glutamine methyltransferase, partial [Paramuribaculum sp.]|nr:peptide chain release factor N(5)-glutamine methyltransferase [Paramuribaculum sp.]
LFVPDSDPLRFYRPIARFAASSLNSKGMLYFEINPDYAKPICDMLNASGFTDVEVLRDTFAKQRFIKATHE